MQCKSCGFLVPHNLKFAIMKNFCPQCGNKLFTEKEMNHISMLQSRVVIQPFSKDLDEQSLYDVSLFLYNEILNGYGRILLEEEIKNISKIKEQVAKDIEFTEEIIEETEDIEKVKEKIRAEEAARVVSELEGDDEADTEIDSKVARLKQIHHSYALKTKNPVVRRLDSE